MFALGLGVLATYVIVSATNVKEEHWKHDRELARDKITELEAKAKTSESEIESSKLRTEELRAANLALEAQIAPRRLVQSQQQKIADALVRFAGRNVAVVSYAMDAESAVLGQQFIEILQAARMLPSNRIATVQSLGGFALGIHVSGPDEELVVAIRKALGNFTPLFIASKEQTSPAMVGAGVSSGDVGANAAASILVGIKPLRN